MTTTLVGLTLEIRSEDGSCAEFFQDQEDSVDRALRLLENPRLLQWTPRFPRPEEMNEPRRLQFRQSKHHA